jgi:hypothetical protein
VQVKSPLFNENLQKNFSFIDLKNHFDLWNCPKSFTLNRVKLYLDQNLIFLY